MKKQNYMPTQAQFQTVIDNLKRADEMAGGAEVTMMNGEIDHTCGTPMCHGGWYAVANISRAESLGNLAFGYLNYTTGAAMITQDLGFSLGDGLVPEQFLEEWAREHYEIWGNENGAGMFSKSSAFNNFDGTLKSIIAHWEGVKERARVLGGSV